MKQILGAAILAAAAFAIPAFVIPAFVMPAFVMPAAAEDVPCENMLKDLRAAESNAKLSDADAAKLKELEDKGIERCNADDDAHADEFFTQAMKILGQ